jgi:hypothetical protein
VNLLKNAQPFLTRCKERGESHRLPPPASKSPVEEVKEYFEGCVGSCGMIVTIDSKTKLVVGAALRSKASANKQGNFLTSIACALIGLLRQRKMHFATEFVELVSVVGYLSNIYEYVTVLGMMHEGWNRNESRMLHGGLVQYVFQQIIGLVGCVTGGSGRQMQTFINKDFIMKDVRSNCHEIKNTVQKLVADRNKDFQEHTHRAMRKFADILLSGLSLTLYIHGNNDGNAHCPFIVSC